MPRLTRRDADIFAALDRTPLTAVQLQQVSATFPNGGFSSERKVRSRLQKLVAAGSVRTGRYVGLPDHVGGPNYYYLAPLGFRMLHGGATKPHSKWAFCPIGVARQAHVHALAEFAVTTFVAAHAFGLPITDYCRENALRLVVGRDRVQPDCAFTIAVDGREYHFVVEIDNATEPLRSVRSEHGWARKIAIYDAVADRSASRFRVLVVGTRNTRRVDQILALANEKVRNAERSLFIGLTLDEYLRRPLPLFERYAKDQKGRTVALLPTPRSSPEANAAGCGTVEALPLPTPSAKVEPRPVVSEAW